MMKRFALLLAALFVASMVLVAPVFASSNHENNNGDHNEKVCVLHKNRGDDHNKGDKDYRWVSEEGNHHGDKVVKDKYCEDNDHKNNNGDHNANANNDDNGHANNNNNDDDNGHANNNNDDNNGHANDDDWS